MRGLPVLLGFLLLATACERRPEPAARRTLSLERCRLEGVSAQVLCGTLEVFEDRAARSGRKLKLHVAVVPALAAQPEPDPLFILAGGPGQAASDVAAPLLPVLERIRRRRDLVFVDQRGTGRSAPLECDLSTPDAGLSEQLNADFDPAVVRRCRESLEKDHDLRHYGTRPAMDDLEDVRVALGYDRINLWGGSYGARAALVYMRQYPSSVRAAVLDGVAPLSLYLPRDMAQDADRSMRLLLEACRKDAACNGRFPELASKFDRLLSELAEAPKRATVPHPLSGALEEVAVSREALVRTLRALLYRPEATSLVPLTLDRIAAGDFRPLVAQAHLLQSGFSKDLSVGMFLSVVCTEDVPFIDLAAMDESAKGTFVGPGFAREIVQACELWPRGTVPDSFREPVRSSLPVLLLSGELDPVTPPQWGEEARQHLENSVHVIVPATGHGTLGNACARRLVERFLESGSVQGLEARCDEAFRPPFFTSYAGAPP